MSNPQPTTESSVWRKLKRHSGRLGQELVETTLKLYYSARDEQTPAWARTVIYGALVYFLVPLDAIPDFLPIGYTDDLSTLLAAIATVGIYVKPDHKRKAKQQTERWFSDKATKTGNATDHDSKPNRFRFRRKRDKQVTT